MSLVCLGTSNASAATNQFRGVNWADARDNFQPGIIYVSGLSSSDTYASASTVTDRVVGQFRSLLGTNSTKLPINEATVSQYWSTYTGAIDMALSKWWVDACTLLGALNFSARAVARSERGSHLSTMAWFWRDARMQETYSHAKWVHAQALRPSKERSALRGVFPL